MIPRRITYESDAFVDVDDLLVTTRSAFLVVAARLMATRDGVQRWALHVDRVDLDAMPGTGTRHSLRWFPRGRRRKR